MSDFDKTFEEVYEKLTNPKKDNINPDHYKSSTSLECIEAMEISFGRTAVIDFCICNAFKYVWRWKNKNGVEDLDKALWYCDKANLYYKTLETLDKTLKYFDYDFSRSIGSLYAYIRKQKEIVENE